MPLVINHVAALKSLFRSLEHAIKLLVEEEKSDMFFFILTCSICLNCRSKLIASQSNTTLNFMDGNPYSTRWSQLPLPRSLRRI